MSGVRGHVLAAAAAQQIVHVQLRNVDNSNTVFDNELWGANFGVLR
jgi:hypothetical protein